MGGQVTCGTLGHCLAQGDMQAWRGKPLVFRCAVACCGWRAREGQLASGFMRDGFPELAAVAEPFAVDWIGRVLALDQSRPPGLLLFQPGSAEAFEIDESFADFFNVDVVDDPDLFLAADLFREWQAAGGEVPGAGQCVGFKAPLFLGGHGIAANLELTGLEVYWSFAAQGRGDSADSHHSIDPVP